jgi:uncharacterized ferritin-like protein (DUF455 family)
MDRLMPGSGGSGEELLRRILLGGGLEDKLHGAGLSYEDLEWEPARNPIEIQDAPGREGALRPRSVSESGKSAAAFPGRRELKSSAPARGRLLHFFANHELLAIESMAYVLLRFPDADPGFRRGVFHILREEQEHFRAYLARMREYGVGFGEVPLNLYFWNSLRGMASPLEYAAMMSLTFEQANLDFALENARLFERELDDPPTARLLRKVHDDEVRHVAHGWRWFQEWSGKEGGGNFERYRKALPFPMSPRRARGGSFFAVQSRRDAGLPEDLIREIRIAGGSRGRVPSLYFFNPQCEVEEEWSTLPAHLQRRIRDLEPLMLWMGLEEDCVEQSSKPPTDFLERVHGIRGFLPEILKSPADFSKHPVFEEFRPWGFGRSAWNRLDSLPVEWRRRPPFERGLHRDRLFSKAHWKRILGGPGRVIGSTAEVDAWLEEIRSFVSPVLIKADRGTSGRGHLRIDPEMFGDPSLRSKLIQRLAREGALVAEPLHSKLADFSVQYEIQSDGKVIEFEPRIFFTDSRFQYQGAMLGRTGAPGSKAMDCILREEGAWRSVHRKILAHLLEAGYTGPLGVDAMVAHAGEGTQVVPVIEVNVRYTMGRVALEIEKAARRARSFRYGVWKFFGRPSFSGPVWSFAELESSLETRFGERYFPALPASTCQETWSAVVLDPDEETVHSWGFSAT